MKYILFLSMIIFVSQYNWAQNILKPKLSAKTQQYLLSRNSKSDIKNPNFVYKIIQNKYYLSALIKVKPNIDENTLKALHVNIGTKAGNIWTAQIPETKFNDFISINGIEYIQLDEPIYPNLEMARKTTRVDSVHTGIGLPLAYTGKNVVVGILDVGLDYTHPTFYDTLGNKFRIKKVWEQKSSGTPPTGFSYGHELTDSLSIITDSTDNIFQTHGTHVAGIAAGSAYGSNISSSKYRGVAYESDIVMVGITPPSSQWTSAGMTDIIDGMNYVYNYAALNGKPAVVNLSWGCTIGPHDGTSLFSQACDNLTGAGKLFVVSAGNNGTNNVHVKKSFTNTDTLLKTIVNFNTSFPQKKTWLDIWGDASQLFKVKLSLYNVITLVNETRFFTLNGASLDTFIVGNTNDTCYFKISLIASDYNSKPHVFIDVYNKTNRRLCLSIQANTGTVHAWQGYVDNSSGIYGSFSGGLPGAIAGNTDYTIGEMACTNSAITIGAYASKVNYTDISGAPWSYSSYVSADNIVPFSSHGPTIDNRMKPDITAPGLTIASAVSGFDTSYTSTGSSKTDVVSSVVSPLNGKTYYYGEMSGTSMSSPMATGIIALFLQANPSLTPLQVKNIITQTAIKDTYTTTTPNPVLWGAGKINAYQALKQVLLNTSIQTINNQINNFEIFPNPNNGEFTIQKILLDNSIVDVNVYSSTGELVFSKKDIMNNHQTQFKLSLSQLANGIYFTTITSGEQKSVFKTCILK